MDTLSTTTASSINIPRIQPPPREPNRLKIPNPSHLPPHSTSRPNSLSINSPRQSNTTLTNPPPFIHPHTTTSSLKPPSTVERKAAVGYAAALFDAGLSNNSLDTLVRDVHKVSKFMLNKQEYDGYVVKQLVKKGRFHPYLVGLVNMLVVKDKVEVIGPVFQEFGKIYDRLTRGPTQFRTQLG